MASPDGLSQARRRRHHRARWRQQSRFFADALHQVRNALATLSTQAGWLASGQAPDAVVVAQAMERRLLQLGRFLAQVDMLQSHQTGQVRQTDVFDVARMAQDIVLDSFLLARDAGVDLGWVGPINRVFDVRGCAAEWAEALANVLDNAIRHTPAGRRIDVGVEWQGDFCALSVLDQGVGVPVAQRQALFGRRVQGVGQDGLKGASGLGLDIAQRLARANQGRIEMTSGLPHVSGERGLGVVLLLPRAEKLVSQR